jgi:hypothetical protein
LYKKINFLEGEVYFPKTTSEYIDSLLKDKSIESYSKLAEIYYNLGNEESMRKYFNVYMESEADYLSKSRLCHIIKEYGLEIKNILSYVENKSKKEKVYYQKYITKLIKENNLNESINLGISRLDILFSYIDDEEGFEGYFYQNKWSREDKKRIVENLKKENLDEKKRLFTIYKKIGNKYDTVNYYYSKVKSNYDYEGYKNYYESLEEKGIEPVIRNEFETLHYLKYRNDTENYKNTIDEMRKRFLKNKEYKKLYTLYKITEDIEILANISIVNEEFAYRYIKEINDSDKEKEEEKMLKLIDIFNKSYQESKYAEDVFKIKTEYISDKELLINSINSRLVKKFDRELLMKKIRIYMEMGKKSEAEHTISEHIFWKYPDEEMVELYIEILNKEGRESELYEKLAKIQNKTYLFNYCREKNLKIPKELELEAVNYYFESEDYKDLYQFKDLLSYEQYKRVIENNLLIFLESANMKYPYEKEWMDMSKFENFYFNEELSEFDIVLIKEILDKKIKNDAEIYYLSKYFYYSGDYVQSKSYLNQIIGRYGFSEEMKNFRKKLN